MKNFKYAVAFFICKMLVLATTLYAFETPKIETYSQLLSNRFSGYSFDPNKPVTQEQLQLIVQAAQLTPSSYNEQPWNFVIADRNTNPAAYEKILSGLVEFNQGWAKTAPVLIVSIATLNSTKNGKPNRWSSYDTGAAAFSIVLQASSMGLMSHQMGGFDEDALRKAINIPKGYTPISVIAIGYPAATQTPTERKRKPVTENFFSGSWGKPFQK